MITRFFDFAAGQVTKKIAAIKHDFYNKQQHKVLREERRKMDEILKQHFQWDKMMDERYHCRYCQYNTQLANKAINHFTKKHSQELVVDQPEPEQEPNQEQDQEQPNQVQDPEQEPEQQDPD